MLQHAVGYGFVIACALIVLLGDTLLKVAADRGQALVTPHIVAGCALYAVSALAWFWAMRHVGLAQAGVVYTMFSLLALCLIGVVWFGERLELRDVAGIACALAAIVLMVRFA